jgi:hypothetical protein
MRRVPKDWVHPKNAKGRHDALFDGAKYQVRVADWEKERTKHPEMSAAEFDKWDGPRPNPKHYMLVGVPPEERTHYQMYETCSEGTPISPVMESPEKLARWCADHGASAFADMTQSYQYWLKVCEGSAGFGMRMNPSTGEMKPV